jgi:hypothetical protein
MAIGAPPGPYVRSFAFDDGEQRVAGGSAVLVAAAGEQSVNGDDPDAEDFGWSKAQTEAFLAGEPLTLRFSTRAPEKPGTESVYVCCWITLDSQ